jgi:hypothetical protein
MATITITEILGSDNLAGSRITINNNFKTLQNAVNTLEQRLNTSFSPGGSLDIGDIVVKKYTRPTSAVIFTVQASGLIQGDFSIVGATTTTGSVTIGQQLNVAGNVVLSNSATPSAGTYTLSNALRTIDTNGYAHEQFYAGNSNSLVVNPNGLTNPSLISPIRFLDPTLFYNRRVIHLDLSTITAAGILAGTDCQTITLPSVGSANVQNGQIVTFVIDLPAASVNTSGVDNFFIDTVNMDPAYTSAIPLIDPVLYDLDQPDVIKTFLTLYASATGWKVLSAHHWINTATY